MGFLQDSVYSEWQYCATSCNEVYLFIFFKLKKLVVSACFNI